LNGLERERALNQREIDEQNTRNRDAWRAAECWADRDRPQEREAAIAEFKKFSDAFPQFLGSISPLNRERLLAWLRDRNLLVAYHNLVAGFEDLAIRGDLVLDATVCGAGPETEVSGHQLANHPNLYKLLLPVPARNSEHDKINKMSAAEFLAATPELHETRIAPLAARKVSTVFDSFLSFHPEYVRCEANKNKILEALGNAPISIQSLEAVYQNLRGRGELELDNTAIAAHGASRYMDLGGREYPGFPSESEKYSFKIKVREMSSAEIASRCNDDPQFRAALDALKK
jgi:hypothetical protein